MRYATIITFQGINWQTEFLIRVFVTNPLHTQHFVLRDLVK